MNFVTQSTFKNKNLKPESKIRFLLISFVIALIVSELTAFPLQTELHMLDNFFSSYDFNQKLTEWIHHISKGIDETYSRYPFFAYGTDWLAFAHLIIAIFFWGAIKDPVRNKWIIDAGIIACILIIPLALIAGQAREIPLFWRCIDCSFGVIGIIPLLICRKLIKNINQ